jgi:hypothetical protein
MRVMRVVMRGVMRRMLTTVPCNASCQ